MKKLIAITLAVVMVLSLAACGGIPKLIGDSIAQKETPTGQSTGISNKTLADILDEINSDFDSTIEYLTAELEAVYTTVGDSYESYLANKQAITDWYALVQSESEELFERTIAKSEEYFKMVVSTIDNDDFDAINAALDVYYDSVYNGVIDDYYDAIYNGLFDDVYDKYYNGIIDDAYDTLDYNEWSNASTESYREWSDASSATYRIWSDASSETYRIWSNISSGFWRGNFDVDAILKEREDAANATNTPEPTPVETPEPTPEVTTQTLSFGGVDFTFPAYYELSDDSTETQIKYETTDIFSGLEFKCEDLSVSQTTFDSRLNTFIDNYIEELDGEVELLKSEKTTIAGMSGWTLTLKLQYLGVWEITAQYAFGYNANEEKTIFILLTHEADALSNHDYLGDFEKMLETAVLTPKAGTPSTPSTTSSSDWRKFLKDYEEFVDAYVAVLKKYTANPLDFSILGDYMDMMTAAEEWSDEYDAMSDELDDPKELAEFIKEWTRIYAKMFSAFA